MEIDVIYNQDCLKGMKNLPDESVDMILCDLPYGTTASKWDSIIPFDKLWEQYERIIKHNGAICLFCSGQFTYKLIASNFDLYRYKWIWVKNKKGNFVNAKNRPMTAYEEIMVFSKGTTANGSKNKMVYNPQGLQPIHLVKNHGETQFGTMAGKRPSHKKQTIQEWTNYPCDVLNFECVSKPIHPTQKPVELLEYLIKTYTNEGEIVLDNCFGSGSTLVAAVNTDRHYIGFEMNEQYFDIACERLDAAERERERERATILIISLKIFSFYVSSQDMKGRCVS